CALRRRPRRTRGRQLGRHRGAPDAGWAGTARHARTRGRLGGHARTRAAQPRRLPRARPHPASRGGSRVTRVLLVDDQPLVRAGLRVMLDAQPDLEVVGEAGDGVEGVELAGALSPDVVCMDVQMPGLDGLEARRRIASACEGPAVLVLTTFDRDDYLFQALEAGAS